MSQSASTYRRNKQARADARKMRPVYDAAMALCPHLDRMGKLSFGTVEGAQAAQVLIEACRRAKEGQ